MAKEGVVSLGSIAVVNMLAGAVVPVVSLARWRRVAADPSVVVASVEMLASSTDFAHVPLSFSLSLSLSLSLASRRGRIRSTMEGLLTFTPSPPSTAPALGARLPRALLKAKKSPNFFLMFLVGSVVAVITGVGLGGKDGVEACGALVGVKDVSADGMDGEVTGTMSEEDILSDKDEMRVRTEGVGLGSEGVAWAGFDSSHRPFLQQEDSRKSNRQEETLSTMTTATGFKAHAQLTANLMQHTTHRDGSTHRDSSIKVTVRCCP